MFAPTELKEQFKNEKKYAVYINGVDEWALNHYLYFNQLHFQVHVFQFAHHLTAEL